VSAFFESLSLNWEQVIAAAVRIIIIAVVMVIAVRLVKLFFRRATSKAAEKGHDTGYLRFFRAIIVAVIYVICIASMLSEIPGLSSFMTAILAGSGIVALFIGIASQEAAGNLISGVMILVFRPFRVGDQIRYITGNLTGIVEEIGLRHTVVRTLENKRVLIPNGLMNTNVVENANYGGDQVSFFLNLAITYSSDPERAMEIMAGIIAAHPHFIDPRTPEEREAGKAPVTVLIKEFAESAIQLQSTVRVGDPSVGGRMKSDLLLEAKRQFEAAGIALAYPTVTLDVPSTQK